MTSIINMYIPYDQVTQFLNLHSQKNLWQSSDTSFLVQAPSARQTLCKTNKDWKIQGIVKVKKKNLTFIISGSFQGPLWYLSQPPGQERVPPTKVGNWLQKMVQISVSETRYCKLFYYDQQQNSNKIEETQPGIYTFHQLAVEFVAQHLKSKTNYRIISSSKH